MPEEREAPDLIHAEFRGVSPKKAALLGSAFLNERNPKLHASQEVNDVVSYQRAGGESIPNQPADKISAYLGFLADREYVNDGILTGDKDSIDRQIKVHVIKAEEVPESYFELQRRIAREQGHGDLYITPEMRRQMIEAAQADQRAGLAKWVEYLGGDDGGYPDWFKYYTWNSVTKLGIYDKEKKEFQKRSRGTMAPYPELNREALAYVFDALIKSREQGEQVDEEANNTELQKLLKDGSFGRLYAHAALEVTPDDPELRNDIRGSWTKFNQTDDPRIARRLSGSLQGHGTGWCTAGESTAAIQLKGGDFYVYYTRDEKDKETVPRVAIRMENGEVAEVRGVNDAQELEPVMIDITSEQLKDLPGGDEYIQKAEDMKRLTALDKKIAAEPGVELSVDDLRFLYQLDRAIVGFGYDVDPRVSDILKARDAYKVSDIKNALGFELDPQDGENTLAKIMSLPNCDQAVLVLLPELRGIKADTLAKLLKGGVLDTALEVRGYVNDNPGDSDSRQYIIGDLIINNKDNFESIGTEILNYIRYDECITALKKLDNKLTDEARLLLQKAAIERAQYSSSTMPAFKELNDYLRDNERQQLQKFVINLLEPWEIADNLQLFAESSLGPLVASALLKNGEDEAINANYSKFTPDAQTLMAHWYNS